MTTAEFLGHDPLAERLFAALARLAEPLADTRIQVSKSQIAFHRHRNYAWVWRPARDLHGNVAPLVLTLALPARDSSPRWKEVVEPVPGHFTHHLELHDEAEVDAEVAAWLQQAWAAN